LSWSERTYGRQHAKAEKASRDQTEFAALSTRCGCEMPYPCA
jgi:hypothetical protein